MKKLFIHQPLFRILSPVFSGATVYLLILLLNNNIEQIQEDFFNEELYFCIGLSYLIQEFSRLLLILFKRFLKNAISASSIVLQILVSMILCLVISTIAIHLYYDYVLGFSAVSEEIYLLNSIFCAITLIYILLYISHQYLFKVNTEKLEYEELIKKNIEDDFKQFKKGINPNLLFESLESLLVLIKNDKEKSDDFIDHLASIYRYVLSGKEKQLTTFSEEISVVKELVQLLSYLPFRNIAINNNCKNDFLVVPSSLLYVIEQIARTTIVSADTTLKIQLKENKGHLEILYTKNDKINKGFNLNLIRDIVTTYQIYSTQKIEVLEKDLIREIRIPKLQITE